MASRALQDLEKQITELNHEDKLWLLEKLARTLRTDVIHDLDDMAADPDIQREISAIDAKRGSREKFERALSRVKDAPPEPHDHL